MVDQLNAFAGEVTRVAREVGTEGRLGGQAQVPGVAGTWKDLTDGVNWMASNLTGQVRNIAQVATAVARGDLSRKITVDVRGRFSNSRTPSIRWSISSTPSLAKSRASLARSAPRAARRPGGWSGVAGTWKDLTDNVNSMAGNLTDRFATSPRSRPPSPWRSVAKITVDVRGEILQLKKRSTRWSIS